jgi:hypothetical protein
MRRPVVVALVSITALAAGCGYSNPSPRDEARATVRTLVQSCAHDGAEGATGVLTRPLQARFSREGSTARACAHFLGVAPAELRRTRIGRVQVRGSHARVMVVGPAGRESLVGVGFSEGEWMVDS